MDEGFRDSLGTIEKDGKRKWIFAKKSKGNFHTKRMILGFGLLSFFFILPFIKINGEQALLIDILNRKFIIFGIIFRPQDLYLLVIIIITCIIFLILFTVIYGRLFCGWVCPQTIFMEMVFRKIEYLIEGDRREQIKLSKQKWDLEKILKKSTKLIIFYIISLIVTSFLLFYTIGKDNTLNNLISLNGAIISFLFIFAGVFFFVFSYFREQACIAVCPYGRLQGVLLDRNSIIVAYDYNRGEPRGKYKKNENRKSENKGDCIDCHNCVDVCPTGIDIRNGTQMECINCTACIDACNEVMEKTNMPKELIKYSSEDGIAKGIKFKFSKRMWGYTIMLFGLIIFISVLFSGREVVDITVLKVPGQMYQEEGDTISNIYSYTLVNKSFSQLELVPSLYNIEGRIMLLGVDKIMLNPEGIREGMFIIKIPFDGLNDSKTSIKIRFSQNKETLKICETNFLSPRI